MWLAEDDGIARFPSWPGHEFEDNMADGVKFVPS